MMNRYLKVGLTTALLLTGCNLEPELAPYLIERPRILAVRTVPAEATPGSPVTREVLAVNAQGQRIQAPLQYSRCDQPKTLGERSYISQACLKGQGLVPSNAQGPIDQLVCQRFGPTPAPPKEADGPRARPTPPDLSGGYYQPEKVQLPSLGLEAFFRIRTPCDLLGATRDVFDAYNQRYRPNAIPNIDQATLSPTPLAGKEPWTLQFAPGQPTNITLNVAPAVAESYVIFEIPRNRLKASRESLTLHWFANGATLAKSEQILSGLDLDRGESFQNTLTLGDQGQARVWLVLEDDRGARSWRELLVVAGQSPAVPRSK